MRKNTTKAFTLIELLTTVAILAALAVIVFTSINPASRISKAKAVTTETNRQSIERAVNFKFIDKVDAFNQPGCPPGPIPSSPTLIASSAYNILPCLSEYFQKMPVNLTDNGYFNDPNDYDTKFYIMLVPGTNKVSVAKSYSITWTQVTVPNIISTYNAGIIATNDGTKIAAAYNSRLINVSTDSGSTWSPKANSGTRVWSDLAGSSDMARIVAPAQSAQLYVSSDTGENWSPSSVPTAWMAAASSTSGQYMAAVVNNGYIYTSSDYGTTWVPRTATPIPGIRAWRGIASSADGSKLVAVVYGGYIYTSSDYGVTWTERANDAARNWNRVASSGDGRYLAAVVNNGYIYTSSDYGATWTERNSTGLQQFWVGVSISADGRVMAAVPSTPSSSVPYISSDYGVTWVPQTVLVGTTGFFGDVFVNESGNKIYAAARDGVIKIGTIVLN